MLESLDHVCRSECENLGFELTRQDLALRERPFRLPTSEVRRGKKSRELLKGGSFLRSIQSMPHLFAKKGTQPIMERPDISKGDLSMNSRLWQGIGNERGGEGAVRPGKGGELASG